MESTPILVYKRRSGAGSKNKLEQKVTAATPGEKVESVSVEAAGADEISQDQVHIRRMESIPIVYTRRSKTSSKNKIHEGKDVSKEGEPSFPAEVVLSLCSLGRAPTEKKRKRGSPMVYPGKDSAKVASAENDDVVLSAIKRELTVRKRGKRSVLVPKGTDDRRKTHNSPSGKAPSDEDDDFLLIDLLKKIRRKRSVPLAVTKETDGHPKNGPTPAKVPSAKNDGMIRVETKTGLLKVRIGEARAWPEEAVTALLLGVKIYGEGNWEAMLQDPRLTILKKKTPYDLRIKYQKEMMKA